MLTGDITWGDVTTVAGIVSAAFVIWWRIESRADRAKKVAYFKVAKSNTSISAAHATATLAPEELAEYTTHVAENLRHQGWNAGADCSDHLGGQCGEDRRQRAQRAHRSHSGEPSGAIRTKLKALLAYSGQRQEYYRIFSIWCCRIIQTL